MRAKLLILFLVAATAGHSAAQQATSAPPVLFHLTARPWKPLNLSRDAYLDSIEGVCRFTANHLGPHGEVIDPLLHREHQYSTPYFAFAVGTLNSAGRAKDLLPHGIAAMDHATLSISRGAQGIPDNHGEFFIPCLTGALEVYKGHVPDSKIAQWRECLRLPIEQIIRGMTNNWRAYAMRGQWMRAKEGLVDREKTIAFIEDSWLKATQRERIAGDAFHLYEDRETDPESHAVEAVGRGNLLGLVEQGYVGPSAPEMQKLVEDGTATTLLLQDPTGQCPPDGRADDHVFNDVLYQLCFDVMAERAHRAGDENLAGRYRHAAMLAFNSIQRWRRTDAPWDGSFFITKNHFDPAQRVGYQNASNIGNYNGAMMLHLSEAYLARVTDIPEQPAPTEIGGYAFATDPKFATVAANAGGMQLFAALRGDTKMIFDHYWTSLGVNRISRVGWESRLGPSDGVRDSASGRGITFAPTWMENNRWIRLADVPDRYGGWFTVQFAHPLLVRCAMEYAPTGQRAGPHFRHEFVITPDGVLATLRSADAKNFGVTWPLLENDGAALKTQIENGIVTTAYDPGADQESFIAVGESPAQLDSADAPLQSSYGWLRPVRAPAGAGLQRTFVYPRGAADPPAAKIRENFHISDDGFESPLGKVHGSVYIGRTSAGGEAQSIDIDHDGKPDAAFDTMCKFVLQLHDGKITAVEADRAATVQIAGRAFELKPFVPLPIEPSK